MKYNVKYDNPYTFTVFETYAWSFCVGFVCPHFVKEQAAFILVPNPFWAVCSRKMIGCTANETSIEPDCESTNKVVFRVKRIFYPCHWIPLSRYVWGTLIFRQYAFSKRGFLAVRIHVAVPCYNKHIKRISCCIKHIPCYIKQNNIYILVIYCITQLQWNVMNRISITIFIR